MGRKVAAATRAAQVALPVSPVTRAPTATISIQVPMLDTKLALNSTAKSRWRRGRTEANAIPAPYRPRPGLAPAQLHLAEAWARAASPIL